MHKIFLIIPNNTEFQLLMIKFADGVFNASALPCSLVPSEKETQASVKKIFWLLQIYLYFSSCAPYNIWLARRLWFLMAFFHPEFDQGY